MPKSKIENYFQSEEKDEEKNTAGKQTKKTRFTWLTSRRIKIAVVVASIILLLISVGAAVHFYWQYKKTAGRIETLTNNEVKSITDKIGKFLELPEEEPTLATVADKEKLSGQPFFAKAQNGDKVLIYAKSQKAILYRPSTGKVIEVASFSGSVPSQENASQSTNQNAGVTSEPIKSESQAEQELPAAQVEPSRILKVAIYNGTNIRGLAKKIADQIMELENFEIVKTGNATGLYNETIVIDLTGGNETAVEKIIAKIGGKKGEMPITETMPKADILIIGGNMQ